MSDTTTPTPADDAPNGKELAPVNFANMELDLQHLTLNQLNFIGKAMAGSGMFGDIKDANTAIVKILAGQEIGVTPFQAMTNINIIQGKATMGANLMAAKLKGGGKYDYEIDSLTNNNCVISIYQLGPRRKLGDYEFEMEDAQRMGLAGKDNWRKYPQAMLFARCISQAVRFYAPDIFNGNQVYTPDELGAEVDQTGEFIEGEAPKPTPPKPPAAKKQAEPASQKPDKVVEQTPEPTIDDKLTDEEPDMPKASKAQIDEVKRKFKEAGITTYAAKTDFCREHIGKPMPSTAFDYNDLSAALNEVIQ